VPPAPRSRRPAPGAVKARTQTTNQLKSLLVTAPLEVRERLQDLKTPALVQACARLRTSGPLSDPLQAVKVVAERAGRLVLKTLADAGGLEQLPEAHEAVSAHHGNNYLPLLDRYYRSHRSALFTLLDTVALEATTADRAVVDAVEFNRANRARTGEYIPDTVTLTQRETETDATSARTLGIDIAFAGESWRTLLRDKTTRASWCAATWRCVCSPTWPPSCAPGTSRSSARTPMPTCMPS